MSLKSIRIDIFIAILNHKQKIYQIYHLNLISRYYFHNITISV